MSVVVKIPFKNMQDIPVKELFYKDSHHAFGVHDDQMNIKTQAISQTTVIFDQRKIGRGVELTFEDQGIELRLVAPSSTYDLETFWDLLRIAVDASDAKEVICDDEVIAVDQIATIREIAETNLASALNFVMNAPIKQKGPITIYGVYSPIIIDKLTRQEFSDQQSFDDFLHRKQELNLPKDKPSPKTD